MFEAIWKVVNWIVPELVEMFEAGVRGEDITHNDLWEKIPSELQTVLLDAIKTEQRRAQGLPT